ncbi:MAG: efflux RND transporter periplasmic adaptor subunit [Cyclobacteriaceae bacterium]
MKAYSIIKAVAWLMLVSACSNNPPSMDAKNTNSPPETLVKLTAEQFKTAGILIGKAEKIQLSENVKVSGRLDVPPQNMVTLSAMLGGFVKETSMLQGTQVKKGQVVAVMEHPSYIELQQQYLEAASKVAYTEKELNRQQVLSKDSVNAVKSLQLATAEYEMAHTTHEALRAKLEMVNLNPETLRQKGIQKEIRLFAPIQGYVTQVYVNVGAYVQPNDPLFKIVDSDHLHAEAIVYEKDIAKLALGQKIRLRLNNEPTDRTGSIYLIGKEIDEDRTVRVHCHLDKEDNRLLPGMFFTAEILINSREVMALPEEAIVHFDGKNYVFVVNPGNTYEMIEVVVGSSGNGYTEVILTHEFDSREFVLKGAYDLLAFLKNTGDE